MLPSPTPAARVGTELAISVGENREDWVAKLEAPNGALFEKPFGSSLEFRCVTRKGAQRALRGPRCSKTVRGALTQNVSGLAC
jgi:hypothetical protein